MSEWISVKDRLPEMSSVSSPDDKYQFSDSVLAFPDDAGDIVVATYWMHGVWTTDGSGNHLRVTHWMPLPDPPTTSAAHAEDRPAPEQSTAAAKSAQSER